MLTVLDSLNLSSGFLSKKGIESPRLNAELLLCNVLNCKRLDLYLSFERPLDERETNLYREHLRRRAQFEPLQYILGNVEFYGRNFYVDKSVLIPRQETEILIDFIINTFKDKPEITAIDIGTGSGIIPISLILEMNNIKTFDAIDISDTALIVAEKNALQHRLTNKIKFFNKNIFEPFENISYDLIISNPPYVSSNEYTNLQKEIREFEPKIAVTDDDDGLKFYRRIVELSKNLLNCGGALVFEVGIGQAVSVKEMLELNSFKDIKIVKDLLNIDRVIYGMKN